MNAPLTDILLASLHHLAVFTAFAALLAEHLLLRTEPAPATVRLIGRLDLIYGASAGVAIIVGIGRVMHGIKGAAFYLDNPVFWAKMGVFALIGLISIAPTLRYLAWNKALKTTGALPDAAAWAQPLRAVRLQLALFPALPVLAVLMARGVGLG